jgi:ribosomal protein S18 acetylase RimI-like enzyme
MPSGSGRVTTRELRWTDFDPLREMYYLLYDERDTNPLIGIHLFAERPSYADEVGWFSGLYQRVLRGDTVVRVAELEGQVVGSCVVNRDGPTPSSETGHTGTLGIMVHRDFRGRGAGRALMRAALDDCRGKFEFVQLSVNVENPRARKLYEEFGFVAFGRRPAAGRRGERYLDSDLLQLDLRPTAKKD